MLLFPNPKSTIFLWFCEWGIVNLTLCLQVVSVGKCCKQCGPRCWPNKTLWSWSGSSLWHFDSILERIFQKRNQQKKSDIQQKIMKNYSACKEFICLQQTPIQLASFKGDNIEKKMIFISSDKTIWNKIPICFKGDNLDKIINYRFISRETMWLLRVSQFTSNWKKVCFDNIRKKWPGLEVINYAYPSWMTKVAIFSTIALLCYLN